MLFLGHHSNHILIDQERPQFKPQLPPLFLRPPPFPLSTHPLNGLAQGQSCRGSPPLRHTLCGDFTSASSIGRQQTTSTNSECHHPSQFSSMLSEVDRNVAGGMVTDPYLSSTHLRCGAQWPRRTQYDIRNGNKGYQLPDQRPVQISGFSCDRWMFMSINS